MTLAGVEAIGDIALLRYMPTRGSVPPDFSQET